jgi:hypothetical protein
MSKTFKDSPKAKQMRTGRGHGRQRNISVRDVRRDPPDMRKLARALIQLAVAQAETDAQRSAAVKTATERRNDDQLPTGEVAHD